MKGRIGPITMNGGDFSIFSLIRSNFSLIQTENFGNTASFLAVLLHF
jgi:hypothetical protein